MQSLWDWKTLNSSRRGVLLHARMNKPEMAGTANKLRGNTARRAANHRSRPGPRHRTGIRISRIKRASPVATARETGFPSMPIPWRLEMSMGHEASPQNPIQTRSKRLRHPAAANRTAGKWSVSFICQDTLSVDPRLEKAQRNQFSLRALCYRCKPFNSLLLLDSLHRAKSGLIRFLRRSGFVIGKLKVVVLCGL